MNDADGERRAFAHAHFDVLKSGRLQPGTLRVGRIPVSGASRCCIDPLSPPDLLGLGCNP
jgi:hypothetical protein